jgi:hypothetical protein
MEVVPRLLVRVFAGVAWVLASLLAWIAVCRGVFEVAFRLQLVQRDPKGGFYGPWADVIGMAALAGDVVIPIVVSVMACRGRLPGTRP